VKVAKAEEQRLAALVSYTKITAPYDGTVVVRNANTGDFLQPATGDLSATPGTPDQPAMRGTPIYVVARTDKVRIFVDVPERDAPYVDVGTKARVRIRAYTGGELDAKVARTSWALGVKTRTLRAEIDLPNPDARLLPGMYVYGTIEIRRHNVQAIPAAAITVLGNQPCCYLLEDGKAHKTPVDTGVSDGSWTEVTAKQFHGTWSAFTWSEQVILGDLSELVDGEAVRVAK
jgi:HlyD family secretion protein